MNRLTAIRMAHPGYTPARRMCIYDSKFYLLTMQNVETDPRCDYMGLADGEYTELLPGQEARRAKTARLNHCNAIREYAGPVWQVQVEVPYVGVHYFASEAAAVVKVAAVVSECERNREQAVASIRRNLALADIEVLARYGKCLGWPGHEVVKVAEYRVDQERSLQCNLTYWNTVPKVERIR